MVNLVKSIENINVAIQRYGALLDDWDHEGAIAPSKKDICNAENFLGLIVSLDVNLPSVFLSREGEINFIWDSSDSSVYIDIGFIDGAYSVYAIDAHNEKISRNEKEYDTDDLSCILGLLNQKVKTL